MALLENVRRFYTVALELEEGPRPNFGIPGYWLYGGGKPIVHLIESDKHFASDKPHYLDHVAFAVTGLDDFTSRLEKMGIEYSVNHIPDFQCQCDGQFR